MKVFVVICEDRHVDDTITVHRTRESADARITEFQSEYDDEWVERDYGKDAGWVRFVDTDNDDGPSARIETADLQ